MSASNLQCAFPGFSSGIGEEDAVKAGTLGQTQCEFSLALVIKEVRCMNQRAALTSDGFFNGGMCVAERIDADAAEQVEIAVTLLVDEVNTFATDKEDGLRSYVGSSSRSSAARI